MATVSNKPWSNFKESDYTDEQWLRACLIVRGPDAGSAKQRGSLPVREPDGTLNKNAVVAAAAALAGARGGVKVSSEEKAAAKKKLRSLYSTIGAEPPESLMHASIDSASTGNTTAAIMATPAPLEPIRLVGNEEKHATLLYFGETNTLPANARQMLLDSVEQASQMLFPFEERVHEVTRLGNDNPPALVAKLRGDSLTQIRNLFLMNPEVKGYLSNTQQFPSFTPHVTLGYPDFAEEVLLKVLMQQIWRVNFDRLSVWWNDERFDFNFGLAESDSLAMSDAVNNFLAAYVEVDPDNDAEQHGVKGQRWGIRRKVDTSTGLVARTDSADQIHATRIAKKLKSGGTGALSNKDLKDFSERIRLEQEFNRANTSAEAQKGQSFVTRFLKSQGQRQFNRVADKALDIAIEKAIEQAGVKVAKKGHEDIGNTLGELSKRLKPKKK